MNSRPLPYQGSALPLSYKSEIFDDGAGDEVRTRDMQLGRLPLYQLSYSRMLVLTTSTKLDGGERRIRTFETFVAELQSAPFGRSGISPYHTYTVLFFTLNLHFKNGADTRIRTVDLLITSQLLYQLSYAGIFIAFCTFRIRTECSLAKLR